MRSENHVLAIDAGNTSIKAGLFVNDELTEVRRFELDTLDALKIWINETGVQKSVCSSVLSSEDTLKITELLPDATVVTNESPLPIALNYSSPTTLGIDRICNAAYLSQFSTTNNAVCIDIGTCVKFDMVQRGKGYVGGSISPGISLRYRSLNDYTGNLPLLSNKNQVDLVGIDTESSIRSGVLNGIQAEIQQLIQQYKDRFDGLTFFVTGGDATFFDILTKNDIFADENLTLKGLYEIYKHNA